MTHVQSLPRGLGEPRDRCGIACPPCTHSACIGAGRHGLHASVDRGTTAAAVFGVTGDVADRAAQRKIEKGTVIDKLGFLVRFWELKARHATLGKPLSASEQVELLSLMQLVTGDFKMPPPGTCARPANPLPAQLIGEGTILAVEVRYICAAALLVASVKSMTLGERAIIRTADAVSGVEYSMPCSLAWVHEASPCIMALVVDGIPVRSDFLALAESAVARDLRVLPIGKQARLVS